MNSLNRIPRVNNDGGHDDSQKNNWWNKKFVYNMAVIVI